MSKHARTDNEDDGLRHPTTKRAKEIDTHPPLDILDENLEKQSHDHPVRNVLHWFRSKDIRAEDNRALHAASQKAKEGKGSLLTMYLFSPKDMDWHGTSAARTDFILRSLDILKKQMEEKHIPLAVITAKERNGKRKDVLDFLIENDISHVFANYEYEVDELRRDISVVKHLKDAGKDISMQLLHDQTVIEPRQIKTGAGTPAKVFTPYHKSWLAELAEDPSYLDTVPLPEANDKKAASEFKKLFETKVPDMPESKQYANDEEKERIRKLWPPGNEAGMRRLDKFLHDKVC